MTANSSLTADTYISLEPFPVPSRRLVFHVAVRFVVAAGR
jgi:hypothetical protein